MYVPILSARFHGNQTSNQGVAAVGVRIGSRVRIQAASCLHEQKQVCSTRFTTIVGECQLERRSLCVPMAGFPPPLVLVLAPITIALSWTPPLVPQLPPVWLECHLIHIARVG